MSRIVFGKIANNSGSVGDMIVFSLMKSSITVGNAPIYAKIAEDGKFCVTLPKGQYSVSLNHEEAVQGIGTVNITDGDIPIDLADALNSADGGTREPNGVTTLYILPRTLDKISPPVASVSMASQKLTDVGKPELPTDASTKEYVDTNIEKVRGYTYVPRIVQCIESDLVNLTQLIDKYKDITQEMLVALDHADTIFPEQQLELGRGALYMIRPTITNGISTLDFTFTVAYYENMILYDISQGIVLTLSGGTWVDMSSKHDELLLERVITSPTFKNIMVRLDNIESLVVPIADYVTKTASNLDVRYEISTLTSQLSNCLADIKRVEAEMLQMTSVVSEIQEHTVEFSSEVTNALDSLITTVEAIDRSVDE